MSSQVRPRLVGLCLIATIALLVVGGGSALAVDDCQDPTDCGGGGGPTVQNAIRTLDVTKTFGTVTAEGINCGTDCTDTDSVQRTCEELECTDWPASTWTLSASGGPAGYSPSWSQDTGCAVGPTCEVSVGSASVGTTSRTVNLTWVDTTAPNVTFAPPAKVGPSGYNVSAGGTDNSGSIAGFTWTVDSVLQAATGSTLSLSGLGHGTHTVTVRARDAAGNHSTTVSRQVIVDKQVALSATAPPSPTNAPTVPFAFTDDADVVTRACSFDGGAYAPCSSGWSGIGPGTPDGTHTYRVRVTDDVGNVAESAAQTVVLDRTDPSLAFTDGPTEGQLVAVRNVGITFSHSDANAGTLQCRLDGALVGGCAAGSPVQLSNLADGQHTFTVRAVDAAGNERTITRAFAVQVPAQQQPQQQQQQQQGGGSSTTPAGGNPAAPPLTGGTSRTGAAAISQSGAATFLARISGSARRGRTTKFTRLRITGLPRSSKVVLTCRGRGCPTRRRTLRHRGGTFDLLKALKRKRITLRPGAVLEIRVIGAGGDVERARWTVRRNRAPRLSLSCLRPGGRAGAC
jgi:hypothetical protein